MIVIRFELNGVLDKTEGKTARAFVGKEIHGLHNPRSADLASQNAGVVDGDPNDPTYVTDAWGQFEGKGGGPGVRGSVGYAVWMADSQRFEVLSLTGP